MQSELRCPKCQYAYMEVHTLTDYYYWVCKYCHYSMQSKRDVKDKLPWIMKCNIPSDQRCIHAGNCVYRTDSEVEHFDYEYQKGLKVCIHLKVFKKKKGM